MSRMIDLCDISCDYCGNWEPGVYVRTDDQRHWLKRNKGWAYDKKERKDICPECLKNKPTKG
jgi:hypothetical protein